MSGLDKILEQIKSDCQSAIDKINSEAEMSVSENRQRIIKETERECENIRSKTKVECEDIIKRGKSSAELSKKQAMLGAKQKIISDLIQKSHTAILQLTDKEYFTIIEKMIEKNAHKNESGIIVFNLKDLERLPQDFDKKISALSNGNLSLSENTANIDGGFVLIYGGIEENCSLNAIFSEKYDDLQDEVYSMLFQ